jgi:hypothetical protein
MYIPNKATSMSTEIAEKQAKVNLTPELIKTLIGTATERNTGMIIPVEMPAIAGKKAKGKMTFKGTQPGVVRLLPDDRVGLHIDGVSIISTDGASGRKFLSYLETANNLAPKGEDYGQPLECNFRRCG